MGLPGTSSFRQGATEPHPCGLTGLPSRVGGWGSRGLARAVIPGGEDTGRAASRGPGRQALWEGNTEGEAL